MPEVAYYVGRAGIAFALFALASMALNALPWLTLGGNG